VLRSTPQHETFAAASLASSAMIVIARPRSSANTKCELHRARIRLGGAKKRDRHRTPARARSEGIQKNPRDEVMPSRKNAPDYDIAITVLNDAPIDEAAS
jgi:hypothetical protein